MRVLPLILCLLLSFAFGQVFPPDIAPYTYNGYAPSACKFTFLASFRLVQPAPHTPTAMILDYKGDLLYYHHSPTRMVDFKLHDNGLMTFAEGNQWRVMDSTFNIIDTLVCDEGFTTDVHDIIMLDNGHYLLVCYQDSAVDLSSYTTASGSPGSANGTLRYNLVQELDANRQAVRQWRALHDYDLADSHEGTFLNPMALDLSHINSLDLNADGELLISHRHFSEVTCLDWDAGQILWRLGGPNDEFSYANDVATSIQHDAHWRGKDTISIYDNGALRSPVKARGIDFALDIPNRTATRIRDFTRNGISSDAMGNYQHLPNGGALINWGRGSNSPWTTFTEYDDVGNTVRTLALGADYLTYRALCFDPPWQFNRPQIDCQDLGNGQVQLSVPGNYNEYFWSDGTAGSTITVSDTGRYWVYVNYGIGMLRSLEHEIKDLANPCVPVNRAGDVLMKRELLGVYDLSGRPVQNLRKGTVYLRKFSDGSAERFVLQ